MSTSRDLPKPSLQGERFIALASKIEISKPDETFDRKFEELAVARPSAARMRRAASRLVRPTR